MPTFITGKPNAARRRAAANAALYSARVARRDRIAAVVAHLSGTATHGQTLTASLTGTATKVTYQWLRDNAPIAGATASTYVLQVADEAHKVSCLIGFINAIGYQEYAGTPQSAVVN